MRPRSMLYIKNLVHALQHTYQELYEQPRTITIRTIIWMDRNSPQTPQNVSLTFSPSKIQTDNLKNSKKTFSFVVLTQRADDYATATFISSSDSVRLTIHSTKKRSKHSISANCFGAFQMKSKTVTNCVENSN